MIAFTYGQQFDVLVEACPRHTQTYSTDIRKFCIINRKHVMNQGI